MSHDDEILVLLHDYTVASVNYAFTGQALPARFVSVAS